MELSLKMYILLVFTCFSLANVNGQYYDGSYPQPRPEKLGYFFRDSLRQGFATARVMRRQFFEEMRSLKGEVVGLFGYQDPSKIGRRPNYATDRGEYTAPVHTNEPGFLYRSAATGGSNEPGALYKSAVSGGSNFDFGHDIDNGYGHGSDTRETLLKPNNTDDRGEYIVSLPTNEQKVIFRSGVTGGDEYGYGHGPNVRGILRHPNYAIDYGGYRAIDHTNEPSVLYKSDP